MKKIPYKGQNLVICITGTPGVGKTSVSRKVAALLNGRVIDVGSLILREKLFLSYDEYRDTYVVDEESLRTHLKGMLTKERHKGAISIIDTHLLGVLEDLDVDYIIVLICDPLLLFNRILSKKVSLRKAVENVVSEFLNQVIVEAHQIFNKSKILIIDTSCKSIDAIASEIIDLVIYRKLSTNKNAKKLTDWSFRAPWISKILSSAYSRT